VVESCEKPDCDCIFGVVITAIAVVITAKAVVITAIAVVITAIAVVITVKAELLWFKPIDGYILYFAAAQFELCWQVQRSSLRVT